MARSARAVSGSVSETAVVSPRLVHSTIERAVERCRSELQSELLAGQLFAVVEARQRHAQQAHAFSQGKQAFQQFAVQLFQLVLAVGLTEVGGQLRQELVAGDVRRGPQPSLLQDFGPDFPGNRGRLLPALNTTAS
jgi:hypothetical protein